MKTTHQMAGELLALPDVPLVIEMWCRMSDHEMVAEMTEYDSEGTAIIWQKPNPKPVWDTENHEGLLPGDKRDCLGNKHETPV